MQRMAFHALSPKYDGDMIHKWVLAICLTSTGQLSHLEMKFIYPFPQYSIPRLFAERLHRQLWGLV